MLQSNNAALLAGNLDISGLSDGFRDGQKLRQEYEGRQQQKALNEIMKVGDHNGRLELAQQHKYAGALVPLLQKYDEDRQKAALDNLKASADIGNTYAQASERNANAGFTSGAKTDGQVVENQSKGIANVVAGNDALANSARPLDRNIFNATLGALSRTGIYTSSQLENILKMANSGDPSDIEALKAIARTNSDPVLAKALMDSTVVTNAGNKLIYQNVDGNTGKYSEPYQQVTLGESPNNFGTRTSGERNNIRTTNASVANNQYTVDAGERNNIRTTDATNYGTNVRANTASEQTAVDWYKAETGAAVAQQNANTAATKAQPVVSADGQPVRKLNTTEQKKLFEIQDQQNADKSVIQTLDKMMKLVDNSYSGVAATGRAKGMSNIGLGGERADNTVLYDNLATSQALAQLKSTFGAAPTEGERKILMDIQASASKTPMQKKQIIAQAFRAVQARQAYREKLANGIRTGQYMIPTAPTTTKPKTKSKTQNSAGASIIGGILGGG